MDANTLLNVKAVAKYLQMKESTVIAWAQEGKLPAIRIGRTWRFRQSDLDAWTARRQQGAEGDKERRQHIADDKKSSALLNVKEVAEYLRVTESTVYTWSQKGKLPGIKIGRRWKFRQVDIDAWIERQAQQTEDDA